jgi:H+/Cl- antiporter ClcA
MDTISFPVLLLTGTIGSLFGMFVLRWMKKRSKRQK